MTILDADFEIIEDGAPAPSLNTTPATVPAVVSASGVVDPTRLGTALAAMTAAIDEAHTIVEALSVKDDVEILRALVKRAKDREAERKVLEIRIRAERKVGEMLLARPKVHSSRYAIRSKEDLPPTLADMGLDSKLVSEWKKIARIAAHDFESILASIKFPSKACVLAAAKALKDNEGSNGMTELVVGFARLEQLEGTIAKNAKAFVETGEALREIRDTRLYKERGYDTFDAYCQEHWKFGRRYAGHVIGACAVYAILGTNSSQNTDIGETMLRPLTPFAEDPDKVLEIWAKAEELAEIEGKRVTERVVRLAVERVEGAAGKSETNYHKMIKPSDNWSFNPVEYGRIDDSGESHGYIPGDVYANVLFRYANHGDNVCDIMAGSGQLQRVYDDRAVWLQGRDEPLDLNIRMFDRKPRGRYKDKIEQHDATKPLPANYRADLIFLDPPYFGMVNGAYSEDADDIANMEWIDFEESLRSVARTCAAAQEVGGLCTIIAPNFLVWERDTDSNQRKARTGAHRIMVCDFIRQWWRDAGYELYDIAYSSRFIQQNPGIAFDNYDVKRHRSMLTDIAEIQTFIRGN